MLNKRKEPMKKEVNEKMNEAIMNDDFSAIENIALNPKYAYVKCYDLNLFNGTSRTNYRWVDISNVGEDYFEDLSSDCQDYVMSLDKYKDMKYDDMVDDYNKPIDDENNKWLEQFKKDIEKSNKNNA